MEFIYLIIGLLIGAALGYLLKGNKKSDTLEKQAEVKSLEDIISQLNDELKLERNESKENLEIRTSLKEKLANAEEKMSQQQEEFEAMKKTLGLEFEKLANKIFEERSERFKVQNKEGLASVLDPLKERLKEFSENVEKTHKDDIKERAGLKTEIDRLIKLNTQLSTDAQNLATALRGESKTQGNWGELILQKVLESSGLEEGREYQVQHSSVDEEGKRLQPDVVVNLPDDKHIVIDSKVSLVAYERLVNADEDESRDKHLKEHLTSIKTHVRQLADKDYQNLYGLKSPDFVLLFVPIEASFAIAVQADTELFNFAWARKIVVVTPSTLLATLRTISSVWKQEKQTRNVQEIARLAGRLYDKFVAYTADLEKVGKYVDQARKAHSEATNKLVDGKDNMIRIAERTKSLGADTRKSLPEYLTEDQDDEHK